MLGSNSIARLASATASVRLLSLILAWARSAKSSALLGLRPMAWV
uniref:Uncharacterized protein n=1 Tax=Rhizophora mucronata TaxID=61149 RepID=A0A2P2LFK5_RHIMU